MRTLLVMLILAGCSDDPAAPTMMMPTPDAGVPMCTADLSQDPGNCGACGHACAGWTNANAACHGGQCALECQPGFADCMPADGCETEIFDDPRNCGACGKVCDSGLCVSGNCAPVALLDGLRRPVGLAVAGANLIFTTHGTGIFDSNDGTVGQLPKTGGTAGLLAQMQAGPRGLAVDDTHAYWQNETAGNISRVPLAGGAVESIVDLGQMGSPQPFAVGVLDVYWMQQGALVSTPKAGGSPTTLAANLSAQAFYIDDWADMVYAETTDDRIVAGRIHGGPIQTLTTVTGDHSRFVVADDNDIYLVGRLGAGQFDSILRESKSGGVGQVALENVDTIPFAALDGGYLYFGMDHRLERLNVSSGAVDVLAGTPGEVLGIAFDETSVYWIDGGTAENGDFVNGYRNDGKIYRVAK